VSKITVAIVVSTLLFLRTGCSPSSSTASMGSHEGHQMDGMSSNSPEMNHFGSSMPTETTTHTKLTLPKQVTTDNLTPLTITVQNHQGQTIKQFEPFQEKLMHLIIVSNDLQFFSHLHPVFRGDGQFVVEAKFPYAGSYTLFSDYKPKGESEQVSVLSLNVKGKSAPASVADMRRNKTFSDTQVSLLFNKSEIKAGEEIEVQFDLKQAADKQPVTNLQPYLGKRGHLVILKQSSPLTRASYIHAHATKNSPTGKVSFVTSFPKSGRYKLWGQFNRGGEIVVADFWVDVQ